MKLKIKPKKRQIEKKEEIVSVVETADKKSKKKNSLPPDEYEPIFEPVKIKVREYTSQKSGEKIIQSLVMKVMRNNYDDGRIYFYITMFQDSESYTGYMKGKTVYFPITKLDDTIGLMCEAIRKCEESGLIEEEIENEKGEEMPF